jgi:hypothetical protein
MANRLRGRDEQGGSLSHSAFCNAATKASALSHKIVTESVFMANNGSVTQSKLIEHRSGKDTPRDVSLFTTASLPVAP